MFSPTALCTKSLRMIPQCAKVPNPGVTLTSSLPAPSLSLAHPQLSRSAILPQRLIAHPASRPLFHPRIQMAKGSFQKRKADHVTPREGSLEAALAVSAVPGRIPFSLLPPFHTCGVSVRSWIPCSLPPVLTPRLVNPSSSFCLGVTAQLVWGSTLLQFPKEPCLFSLQELISVYKHTLVSVHFSLMSISSSGLLRVLQGKNQVFVHDKLPRISAHIK